MDGVYEDVEDEVKTNRLIDECLEAACNAFLVAATTGVMTSSGSWLRLTTLAYIA